MTRHILIVFWIAASTALIGCSRETTTKDTISETNRPPVPSPGTVSTPSNRPRKQRPNENPFATPEPTDARPAAEDSEYSVMMNADGSISEFRTFDNHRTIVRAEVRWSEPTDKRLKVELRDRRTLEAQVPAEFNLREVGSAQLLAAARPSRNDPKADRPRVVGER
jgi:hypothetical protein